MKLLKTLFHSSRELLRRAASGLKHIGPPYARIDASFSSTGTARMITVIDVMREMRIEPHPDLTWSVGAIVSERWRQANGGRYPLKMLRPKTAGNGGSHCFALYPESWRPIIRQVIQQHYTEAAKQGDLFQ